MIKHVCYFGTYRQDYCRNRVLIEALRSTGCKVTECHSQLWGNQDDRLSVFAGGWSKLSFLCRFIHAQSVAVKQLLKAREFDIVILGYPAVLDIFLAAFLCKILGKTLVSDVYMSLFLVAGQRGIDRDSPVTTKLLRLLEKFGYSLPKCLLIDTAAHRDWLCEIFGIAPERFALVPNGAGSAFTVDQEYDSRAVERSCHDQFVVAYHGSFLPSHSVLTIVEAASVLRTNALIRFKLIGDGPDMAKAKEKALALRLPNIDFTGWLPEASLVEELRNCHLILGVFGRSRQSMTAVHNKIIEALALKRAVLTGDSPAVRAALFPGRDCLVCSREDAQDLAAKIFQLAENPLLTRELSVNGYKRYIEDFSPRTIGDLLQATLQAIRPNQ